MGKYNAYQDHSPSKAPRSIHPIWRGVGFVFMVIAPVIAFFTTTLLLDENLKRGWFVIPSDLIANGNDPYLYIKIIGTLVIVFLLYILFMFVTFFIYRIFGPSRLGPQDAPQRTFGGRRYKR